MLDTVVYNENFITEKICYVNILWTRTIELGGPPISMTRTTSSPVPTPSRCFS